MTRYANVHLMVENENGFGYIALCRDRDGWQTWDIEDTTCDNCKDLL